MSEAETPTVFVVDDEDTVRRGLERLLRASGLLVECFPSATELLAGGHHLRQGCLVLDVSMPDLSGLELQDELRRAGQPMPIVFLTGHGEVSASVKAMKSGAFDFLQKPVDETDLLAAVHGALARQAELTGRTERRREAQRCLDTLTAREREVLDLVVGGLLNKQIARKLGISEKTVKVHRGRVMKKTGAGSLPALVRLTQSAQVRRDGGAPVT